MLPHLFLAKLILAFCARASAATFGVAGTVGVMQQPTSHYYHLIYGIESTVGTDSEGFLARLSYLERPEFRDDGYSDKDYGWFAMVGTKVMKPTFGGALYAYIGAGRMAGYTGAINAAYAVDGKTKSTYLDTGITTAIAYAVRFGRFELAAEHQVFVGFVDKAQVEGYVAWPFTFFQIRAGVAW